VFRHSRIGSADRALSTVALAKADATAASAESWLFGNLGRCPRLVLFRGLAPHAVATLSLPPLSAQAPTIAFFKVENDGFGLGAQQRSQGQRPGLITAWGNAPGKP